MRRTRLTCPTSQTRPSPVTALTNILTFLREAAALPTWLVAKKGAGRARFSLTWIAEWIEDLLRLPEWVSAWFVAFIASLILFGFMMGVVLVLIWLLRKIFGFIQIRLGPMMHGYHGIFQTPADALKMLTKEDVAPARSDRWVFLLAPMVVFVPAYMLYVVIPFGEGSRFIAKDLNIGILYLAAVSSIAVIGIIMAGWASENKYSLLGALRGAAQLVSYEVPMALAFIGPVILSGSLSMQSIVKAQDGWFWNWFVFQPWGVGVLGFLLLLVAALAETNQVPFDLPEAESELVAGFNVEYSGMKFGLFFMAEFANTFTLCAIAVTLFWGGWQSPVPGFLDGGWWSPIWFLAKTAVGIFVFMWIRATYPRVRVDQLMEFAWKMLIPIGLFYVIAVAFFAVVV